jgi:hypothetical protein
VRKKIVCLCVNLYIQDKMKEQMQLIHRDEFDFVDPLLSLAEGLTDRLRQKTAFQDLSSEGRFLWEWSEKLLLGVDQLNSGDALPSRSRTILRELLIDLVGWVNGCFGDDIDGDHITPDQYVHAATEAQRKIDELQTIKDRHILRFEGLTRPRIASIMLRFFTSAIS